MSEKGLAPIGHCARAGGKRVRGRRAPTQRGATPRCMAIDASYALFPTAIGTLGIAWGARGIVGVFLPEASEAATRRRIARRFPSAR